MALMALNQLIQAQLEEKVAADYSPRLKAGGSIT